MYRVLHVDLDRFIAAVEMLRRPESAGRPVVGGHGDPTRRGVMAVLRDFGPTDGTVVEVLGWDEAFVGARFDGAGTDAPEDLAGRVREAVRAQTRLTCCVGVGVDLLRAETATGFAKPPARSEGTAVVGTGVFTLTAENWDAVMGGRSTRSLGDRREHRGEARRAPPARRA